MCGPYLDLILTHGLRKNLQDNQGNLNTHQIFDDSKECCFLVC